MRLLIRRMDHDFGTAIGIEIGTYRNARMLPRWIHRCLSILEFNRSKSNGARRT